MATRLPLHTSVLAACGLVASAVSIWLLTGPERILATDTESATARVAYLRGKALAESHTVGDLQEAIPLLREAIQADTSFAEAYVTLAEVFVKLGRSGEAPPAECYPRARAAILQALNLDDQSGEAQAIRAIVITDYLWGWQEAEQIFQKALTLAPNSAPAHLGYAELLVRLRRFDEARRHALKGSALDPGSPDGKAVVAMVDHFSRTANKDDAGAMVGDDLLGSLIRLELASADETAAAGQALEIRGKESYASPYLRAAISARLGDRETAFHLLSVAVDGNDPLTGLLAADPAFDALRDDPRMADLLDYMDLLK
jgi:tetratricopeptide (TPR) repeat protein